MGNNLDRELADVAGLDEDAHPHEADVDASMAVPRADSDRPSPGGSQAPKKLNLGLLGALLLMFVGIVCLFMFGFKEAAIYSMPVDQFLAQKDQHVDRRVRIEGELVPGTLKKRDSPCEYRFTVKGETGTLAVRYAQCVIPDTFRDVPEGGVEVTAEGVLAGEHFEADLIMAKCASKYDPETHTMEGQEQATATD